MADFSSSNASLGGTYDLGYTLDDVKCECNVEDTDEYLYGLGMEDEDVQQCIQVTDEEEIVFKLVYEWKSENVVYSPTFTFPESQREDLAKYFSQVSQMLMRNK